VNLEPPERGDFDPVYSTKIKSLSRPDHGTVDPTNFVRVDLEVPECTQVPRTSTCSAFVEGVLSIQPCTEDKPQQGSIRLDPLVPCTKQKGYRDRHMPSRPSLLSVNRLRHELFPTAHISCTLSLCKPTHSSNVYANVSTTTELTRRSYDLSHIHVKAST